MEEEREGQEKCILYAMMRGMRKIIDVKAVEISITGEYVKLRYCSGMEVWVSASDIFLGIIMASVAEKLSK